MIAEHQCPLSNDVLIVYVLNVAAKDLTRYGQLVDAVKP